MCSPSKEDGERERKKETDLEELFTSSLPPEFEVEPDRDRLTERYDPHLVFTLRDLVAETATTTTTTAAAALNRCCRGT